MSEAETSLDNPVQSTETHELLTLMEASRMDESEEEVLELNQEESTDEEELYCRPKRKSLKTVLARNGQMRKKQNCINCLKKISEQILFQARKGLRK